MVGYSLEILLCYEETHVKRRRDVVSAISFKQKWPFNIIAEGPFQTKTHPHLKNLNFFVTLIVGLN
jgi:hypothetical protein